MFPFWDHSERKQPPSGNGWKVVDWFMCPVTLSTHRLVLRPWKPEDLDPFAALNADPEVMRYFPSVRSRKESDASAAAARRALEARGWGLWAVERPGVAPFIRNSEKPRPLGRGGRGGGSGLAPGPQRTYTSL